MFSTIFKVTSVGLWGALQHLFSELNVKASFIKHVCTGVTTLNCNEELRRVFEVS